VRELQNFCGQGEREIDEESKAKIDPCHWFPGDMCRSILDFGESHFKRFQVVESDKLPKSRRPKEITTVHCGEHMVRDLEVRRPNSLKGSRHGWRRSGLSDPEGHMSTDCVLWVEVI
jgi:hypothetical protein